MSNKFDYIFGILRKAAIDYQTFLLIDTYQKNLREAAAFHAQQAVEKWLKALLIFQDQQPPRTHDIEVLLELLSPYYKEFEQPQWYRMAESLSDFGVDVRYIDEVNPRLPHEVDLAQVKQTLEEFRKIAKEKLGEFWLSE